MSTNVDWAVAEALQTVIEAITPAPDAVQIVPAGAEKHRPSTGEDYWVNIAIQTDNIAIETSNAFVNTTELEINIGIENTKPLGEIAEYISNSASSVLQTVIYSTLAGYARRTPEYSIQGYSGGDNKNSIFWYTFTCIFEHQVES